MVKLNEANGDEEREEEMEEKGSLNRGGWSI